MSRALIAAWLAGEALVIWRIVHREHRPPAPGALLGVTVLFAGLGAMAEVGPQAARLAVALGWGLDIASFLNALPAGLSGQIKTAEAAQGQAEGVGGQGTVPA